MNSVLGYLVPIILVGYIIYNVFRIVLQRKLNKERRDYEGIIEEKMAQLQRDIQSRSRDLHDSIQMINQEYTKVMRSMSLQQRQEAEKLTQKLKEYQEHVNLDPDAHTNESQCI